MRIHVCLFSPDSPRNMRDMKSEIPYIIFNPNTNFYSCFYQGKGKCSPFTINYSVFNKGRRPAKLAGYFTPTRRLL